MVRVSIALVTLLVAACSDSASHITTIVESAHAAAQRGELAQALRLVEGPLTHAPVDDSVPMWRLRLLRGELYLMQRDLTAAAAALEVSLPQDPSFSILTARHRYLLARLQIERNDLAGGVATANEARQLAGADEETQFDLNLLLGRVHLLRGQWDEALGELSRVLESSTHRYKQLQALNNLGYARLREGRYDEALTWLERALGFTEFETTTFYATAITNAGICYSRLGLQDRAVRVQERAVAIQRLNGGTTALIQALGSLGNTHVLNGTPEKSLPLLREALDIAEKAGLKDDAALWAVNLAASHALLGEWDETERYNNLSRSLGGEKSRVKPAYLSLNAADVARGRNDHARSRALYEEALAMSEGAPPIVWTAHKGLAEAAIARKASDDAARHFELALATVEKTRSGLLEADYRLSFLTQLIDFYRAYVDLLVQQGRSDRALEIADSSRGRVLAERQRVEAPARVNAANVQRVATRTNTTLLSYWLAPKRSFLWVIGRAGIRRVDLPPSAEIETAVREYRALTNNSMANPLDKPGTAGDRLYQMLVAPAKLPHNASVVIVPDGALYSLNFETLPVDGTRRHYWIEDAQVQIAPSLAMLSATQSTTKIATPRLLLIGNPTPRAPEFPALSYAPAEMTGIVRHFAQDNVTALDNAKATPAAYQDAVLDRFSMIHFTAHATANVENPLDSAVILSGPDTAYKLYARDVAEKPLKAELVTVSACRSAGERTYSGEGLVGFAWAFLRAGAQRVVAGLWDVDDRSTAMLMKALYDGLSAGHAPAAALREAKLALIASGGQLARPYYWGPFQMFTTKI